MIKTRILQRVTASASVILLAGGAGVLGLSAAQAADSTGGTGTVTLTPSQGFWGQNAGTPVDFQSDLQCPVGTNYAEAFVAEPGSEAPSTNGSVQLPALYPFSTTRVFEIDAAGHLVHWTNSNLLDNTFFASATWRNTPAAGLLPNHAYSLGFACIDDNENALSANGKTIAAWTSFRTGASVTDWSVPPKLNPTTTVVDAKVSGTSVVLTATVSAVVAGGVADDAKGVVQFFEGTTKVGESAVAAGKATATVAGLAAGSTHSYTASFVPADPGTTGPFYSGSQSTAASVTLPVATTSPAPTTTSATPTSTSTSASHTATSTGTSSLTGSGTTSTSADPTSTKAGPVDTGASHPGGGVVDPPVAPPNNAFAPLTDWVGQTVASPTGATGLFALLLGIGSATALALNLLTSRTKKH